MGHHRLKRSKRIIKYEVGKNGEEIKVIKYEDNTVKSEEEDQNEH